MKSWYFDKRKCKGGGVRAVLKAPNNECTLVMESYLRKGGLDNGIESVKENAPFNERYKRLVTVDGKPYFNLTARNNKVIGTSEPYETEQAMEDTIMEMIVHAQFAEVKQRYSWWNFAFETVYGQHE